MLLKQPGSSEHRDTFKGFTSGRDGTLDMISIPGGASAASRYLHVANISVLYLLIPFPFMNCEQEQGVLQKYPWGKTLWVFLMVAANIMASAPP